MRDGVTASRRRLSAGLRNHADCGDSHTAELCLCLQRKIGCEMPGEDDGCMVATPSKSAATLDLSVPLQMRLP